jgi:cytochrome c-type biogenesis protein CcmH/NrfG
MENQTPAAFVEWNSTKVYFLGGICMLLGLVLGALFHGPVNSAINSPATATSAQPRAMGQAPPQGNPHSMVANAVPAGVLERLKSDPTNFDLLAQAGNAEMKASDPKSAVIYYDRALKVKDDPEIRTNLANAFFRSGDADQSLAELAKVLKADPKNDKALYNTGVVKLMGKNDPKGAIASWETLLRYYPNHPHKAQVQEMIKKVKSLPKA